MTRLTQQNGKYKNIFFVFFVFILFLCIFFFFLYSIGLIIAVFVKCLLFYTCFLNIGKKYIGREENDQNNWPFL